MLTTVRAKPQTVIEVECHFVRLSSSKVAFYGGIHTVISVLLVYCPTGLVFYSYANLFSENTKLSLSWHGIPLVLKFSRNISTLCQREMLL